MVGLSLMNWRARYFMHRLLNVLRPKPRYLPLRVNDILLAAEGRTLVERFNDLYYTSGVGGTMHWRELPILKNPCDLWIMTELIQSLRPSVIVETGTHYGGSARFFADMASLLGVTCRVVTVDINPKWSFDPGPKGITSLVGRSTDPSVHRQVVALTKEYAAKTPGHVMVVLDSDHSRANVLSELRLYAPLVTHGSYIVVEDTIVNGHPSFPSHGPGPWEAVREFLEDTIEFSADRDCERHLLTSNPGGWLRRRSPVEQETAPEHRLSPGMLLGKPGT